MRISFTEELSQLEAALQEEGDLVLRALRSSLNALARGDEELADEVIRFDDEVDRRYAAIENGVQSLLARQTPVAADLRLVLAVLRINLHLERMADYCVTVAKLTKLMGDLDVEGEAIARSIEDMGQRAEQMIRVSLDSFAARDADKALTLVELDELIDRANRNATEDVLSLGDSPQEREYGLRMLVVSRCVERIGDHAVDIGEQVVYLVTGETTCSPMSTAWSPIRSTQRETTSMRSPYSRSSGESPSESTSSIAFRLARSISSSSSFSDRAFSTSRSANASSATLIICSARWPIS